MRNLALAPDQIANSLSSKRKDVRTIAKRALLQLLEPLAGFVIDTGLSTNELHSMLRQAAVRSVANRQLEIFSRVNISGIAAATGIPRAEISRILKLSAQPDERKPGDRKQNTTNRILMAWHQVPRFTDSKGQPADLKLYGRGATFESLVRSYGRGIPTRAVLDELIRTRTVEVLSSQKIRAKASIAVDRGISPEVIEAFGDRATELLSTLLFNMRQPENPQFIATVSGSTSVPNALPLFQKELSNRGAEFLAIMQDNLIQTPINGSKRSDTRGASKVSVTVFYHESTRKKADKTHRANKRRNFQRNSK